MIGYRYICCEHNNCFQNGFHVSKVQGKYLGTFYLGLMITLDIS